MPLGPEMTEVSPSTKALYQLIAAKSWFVLMIIATAPALIVEAILAKLAILDMSFRDDSEDQPIEGWSTRMFNQWRTCMFNLVRLFKRACSISGARACSIW